MEVTATEFKPISENTRTWSPRENIWSTRNGETVAKVINPNVSSVDILSGALEGKVPQDMDRSTLREERLRRYELDD